MKEKTVIKILAALLACAIVFNILQALPVPDARAAIESELRLHLKSRIPEISLQEVVVVTLALDGTWTCVAKCLNKEIDIHFAETFSFNPTTKEIIGYSVLVYEENE